MQDNYLRSQKILHWLLAVLILFWLFVSGEFAAEAEGSDKTFILSIHSGGALVILALMLFRYSLRRRHPVITAAYLKPWEATWSRRIHLSFYLLLCLMVASGILQAVFFDQEVRVAGLFNISLSPNEPLHEIFHEAHELISLVFKVLIILHVLAALKHQFIDKQSFIRRMW